MLRIHELDVAAGKPAIVLIRGLSVTVAARQVVLVTGPSGCGKTTLLRAVAGLVDPVAGQVDLDGRDGDAMGWHHFRRQVMLVGQRPVLLEGTVADNLTTPFAYRSVDRRYPAKEASATLATLGLEPGHLEQEARTLSEGQQQRVCLLRALLLRPRVLLLDEPTSALDDATTGRLDALLRQWVETNGAGVIMVRHDRERARRIADREVDLQPHLAGQREGVLA
ncbi:MAG: ATP-binding cassette domain-containing protein [Phycisphaeraceae bacterium]